MPEIIVEVLPNCNFGVRAVTETLLAFLNRTDPFIGWSRSFSNFSCFGITKWRFRVCSRLRVLVASTEKLLALQSIPIVDHRSRSIITTTHLINSSNRYITSRNQQFILFANGVHPTKFVPFMTWSTRWRSNLTGASTSRNRKLRLPERT